MNWLIDELKDRPTTIPNNYRITYVFIINQYRVEKKSLFFWWDNIHPSYALFNTLEEAEKWVVKCLSQI